jgi:UPF0288 family protein (methanogenesis marker protein 3)
MKTYQHNDSLDQLIKEGDAIAFTSSYLKGVKIGIVKKLTRCRVKITYKYQYKTTQGNTIKSQYQTLVEPRRTIVLSHETLPQSITMYMLVNG